MDQDTNPSGTVPGADDVGASGGGENGSVVSLKDLLAEATGRTFKSDEDALASVKETYRFVGKAGQQKTETAPIDTSKFVPREEFEELSFYGEHPELKQHKELLSSLRTAKGITLEEASKLESFKTVIDKARAKDEIDNSKSVLQTNSRLGQVTDKFTQAREQLASGNDVQARQSATQAVLDAYELK